MSHQQNSSSATIADPFEFARQGERIEGTVDAAVLPRLIDVLQSTRSQPVHYTVTGESRKSVVGEAFFLRIEATGELALGCQRCLEEIVWPIKVDACLMLVSEGSPLPDDALEDDSFDPVHVGRDFDVVGAVEEELVLALPLAPVHEACEAPVSTANADDASPFAVLKGFKRDAG